MAKPTKKQLIEKYGKENVSNWDDGVEVDKLYDEYEDIKKTKKYLIHFEPESNRPFMVYKYSNFTGEYESYSGEESFKHAVEVARNL